MSFCPAHDDGVQLQLHVSGGMKLPNLYMRMQGEGAGVKEKGSLEERESVKTTAQGREQVRKIMEKGICCAARCTTNSATQRAPPGNANTKV